MTLADLDPPERKAKEAANEELRKLAEQGKRKQRKVLVLAPPVDNAVEDVVIDPAADPANPVVPKVIMVDFDMEDAADATEFQSKLSNLKLDFDQSDVEFWFEQLEMHLFSAGVKSQWTKRLLLHKQLPVNIVQEVKDLLRKNKATAGATPYKDLKTRILDTFGNKPEDSYAKAEAMLMTGKPSQLLNQIINTICVQHPNLENCCAAGVIYGMWKGKLPQEVRQSIAGKSIVGTDNMRATLQTADASYDNLKRPAAGAAVAAYVQQPLQLLHPPPPLPNSTYQPGLPVPAYYNPALDTSADTPALQVAAAARGQPYRGGRSRGRGAPSRGRGQTGQQRAPGDRGNPHPDGPPPSACNTHYKYGRGAFKCRKPDSCPWASYAQ